MLKTAPAPGAIGPVVTFVFETRDTVRFQIQEMARAEKLTTTQTSRSSWTPTTR